MASDDALEADVQQLRRELLAWVLSEVRSGRWDDAAKAPLAADLVAVVREGLGQAVEGAVARFDDQRTAAFTEALRLALHDEMAGVAEAVSGRARAEARERQAGSAAVLSAVAALGASLDERLKALAKRAPTAPPERRRAPRDATEARARPQLWWLTQGLVVASALALGVIGGYLAHRAPPGLQANPSLAERAGLLGQAFSDLAANPGAADRKGEIATASAATAQAIERAASARSQASLTAAHRDALNALEFVESALKPTTAQAAPPPPAAAPPPAQAAPPPAATHHRRHRRPS